MNVKSIAGQKPLSDDCRRGAVRVSNEKRIFVGANAMSSFFACGLLITLCASASAATVHRLRHEVIVRANQGYAVYGWAYARPRFDYAAAPSYNDPSKYGGGTALPAIP